MEFPEEISVSEWPHYFALTIDSQLKKAPWFEGRGKDYDHEKLIVIPDQKSFVIGIIAEMIAPMFGHRCNVCRISFGNYRISAEGELIKDCLISFHYKNEKLIFTTDYNYEQLKNMASVALEHHIQKGWERTTLRQNEEVFFKPEVLRSQYVMYTKDEKHWGLGNLLSLISQKNGLACGDWWKSKERGLELRKKIYMYIETAHFKRHTELFGFKFREKSRKK
jgi:hypothetical protein